MSATDAAIPVTASDLPDAVATEKKRTLKAYIGPAIVLFWALLVVTYYGFMAKDRYVATSQFAVTRGNETGGSTTALSSILGSSQSNQDAYMAIARIESSDMMDHLEEQFGLREHFSQAGADFLLALDVESSPEDLWKYYKKRIDAYYNEVEGVVTFEIEAFTPERAKEMADEVLAQIERFLNESNRSVARRRMEFVQEELGRAELLLAKARESLLEFQNEYKMIDPEFEVRAGLELVQAMKKEKLFRSAEKLQIGFDSPNSPKIEELQSLIRALEVEIENEVKRFTGEAPDQLNAMVSGFRGLRQELDFAVERYQQSQRVAEEIRIQTLQEHRFLNIIDHPFLPQDALRPRRVYMAITWIILGVFFFMIVKVILATIAEHRQ